MSSAVDRILSRGKGPDLDSEEYRAFIDSGGKPQMGFAIVQADGTMDGFFYHSLNNVTLQRRNEDDILRFTHRGTAVTIHGRNLKPVFRAIMRNTLMEICEPDGRPAKDADQPVILRLAIDSLDSPRAPISRAK